MTAEAGRRVQPAADSVLGSGSTARADAPADSACVDTSVSALKHELPRGNAYLSNVQARATYHAPLTCSAI